MQTFRMGVLSGKQDRLQPGMYSVELNVSVLEPGQYIYKLTADGVVRTKKMMVGG